MSFSKEKNESSKLMKEKFPKKHIFISIMSNLIFKLLLKEKKRKFLILYISIFFSLLTSSKEEKIKKLDAISKINIVVKGTGTQQILSDYSGTCTWHEPVNFNQLPDEIIVNGVSKETKAKFYDLDQEINNISLIYYDQLKDCSGMFYGLDRIINIDFSEFDGSGLTDIRCMFYGCSSITSLDLNSFNTSLIEDMNSMFCGCWKLTSINLNSFDTSNVKSMLYLFSDCYELKSLNLKSFNTSLVSDMDHMFFYCTKLTELNLDNFNTSSVKSMVGMFEGCRGLTSLDLSNFNTASCTTMYAMFMNCHSLVSLNLNNFKTSSVENMREMFSECFSLISLDINSFDTSNVVNMERMFKNCISLVSLDLKNFNTEKLSVYSDMFLNTYNLTFCTNQEEQSIFITLISNYSNNNDCSNFCFSNSQKKYILDKKTCLKDCRDDNIYIYEYNNNICYNKCPSGTFLYEEKCILNDCEPYDFFQNLCEINDKYLDNIIDNIKNGIKEDPLKSLIENKIVNQNEDLVVKNKNITYQFTSSLIQNNRTKDNISIIKLGDCENSLRRANNISDNDPLLILKIDVQNEGFLIPSVEYEVYNMKTKEKLNLTVCYNTTIDLILPVSHVEKDLFKHNPSSNYYNDICFAYTSDKKTDIILKDRKCEFIEKNLTLCHSFCEYKGYEEEIQMSKCECRPKNNISKISEISINTNNFLKKFVDIKNIMNLKVMKCYKLLFTQQGLIKNIGSYIILLIFLVAIISIFIFLFKGYKDLCIMIDGLLKINRNPKIKKVQKKGKNLILQNCSINVVNFKNNDRNDLKNKKTRTSKKANTHKIKIMNKKYNKPKKTKTIFHPPPKFKAKKKSRHPNIYKAKLSEIPYNSLSNMNKSNSNINISMINKNNSKENKNIATKKANDNNFKIKNDNELNTLNYMEAIKIDKRTYFQYYISLIKRKQKLIFTFFINNDYNSKIIKICLFFFSFALFFNVNALFFSDSTMHKIYEDRGKFNFLYQIQQILYSTIISSFVNTIVTKLSLTENYIIIIKRKKNIPKKREKILKCFKIKFIFFFVLVILFLLFFWYYLSSFCAVYKNTQFHLIEDTIISFILSLLYPFGLSFLPGILRIPALRAEKKDKELLYKISKLIQLV